MATRTHKSNYLQKVNKSNQKESNPEEGDQERRKRKNVITPIKKNRI